MRPYLKLIKNNWLPGFNRGWGNGYVVVPPGHPLHGVSYQELRGIDVHGGLTYSEPDIHNGWCLGFDTAHFGDTQEYWTIQRVEEEALKLLEQIENWSDTHPD